MTQLNAKQWQAEFTQSIFQGLSPSLSESLSINNPDQQQQRFAIYQNNVFYSLTQSLADLYPVIKRLVGEDFFNGTASMYIRQHPPKQAAMVFFGSHFPDFLRHFEHTENMLYLADVAKLELERHHAYHAADADTLKPEDFATVDEYAFEKSKFIFHPSVRLVDSSYPIFRIWQSNQSDNSNDENIDLSEPEWVIIVRQEYECQTFNIDQGTYRFYHALQQGHCISEAVAYGLEVSDFDISAAIALGIQNSFYTELLPEQ